jgi:hypothetical protein
MKIHGMQLTLHARQVAKKCIANLFKPVSSIINHLLCNAIRAISFLESCFRRFSSSTTAGINFGGRETPSLS